MSESPERRVGKIRRLFDELIQELSKPPFGNSYDKPLEKVKEGRFWFHEENTYNFDNFDN